MATGDEEQWLRGDMDAKEECMGPAGSKGQRWSEGSDSESDNEGAVMARFLAAIERLDDMMAMVSPLARLLSAADRHIQSPPCTAPREPRASVDEGRGARLRAGLDPQS